MTNCPHCNSPNFRIQEPGVLNNSYYCNNCKKSFEKLAPKAKLGIFSAVVAVGAGFLEGFLGDSGGDV